MTPWSLRITLVSFRPNPSADLSILALAKYGLQPKARTSCWGQLDLDGGLSWYEIQSALAQSADSLRIAQTGR